MEQVTGIPPTPTAVTEHEANLRLNGDEVSWQVSSNLTLADALRDRGFTGTHLGCEHGVCGACTILLDGEPVRSCLLLAAQADGCAVETVEGLASVGELHVLQRCFGAHHALQCGFCTPGFLMLAVWLLSREPNASEERIREVLSTNLCRCTGYTPIVQAVAAAREEVRR